MVAWSVKDICRHSRWLFFINAAIAVTFACLYCFFSPKEYAAQMELTDEHRIPMDLAVGLDLYYSWAKQAKEHFGEEGMRDPEIYSKYMTSMDFFNALSSTYLEKYDETYSEYILNHRKEAWWNRWLEEDEDSARVLNVISNNARYKLNTKYATIKLQVTDPDPEVAAIIVVAMEKLLGEKINEHWRKANIIKYRKAVSDWTDAEADLNTATEKYYSYVDSHQDAGNEDIRVTERSLRLELDAASERQAKLYAQMQRYKMLSERTVPAFYVIKQATIPHESFRPVWWAAIIMLLAASLFLTLWFVVFRFLYVNRQDIWR